MLVLILANSADPGEMQQYPPKYPFRAFQCTKVLEMMVPTGRNVIFSKTFQAKL